MGRSLSCLTVYVYSFSVILHGVLVSFTDGRCEDPSVLSGNAGDIQTPNYPNSYPSRSKCSWLVQVPIGYKIKLQFYYFVLEDTFQCGSDFLKVYDGSSSSAEPLGIYCGRKNPFHVESTSTNLFMTFKSDGTLNYRGFSATFSAIAVQPLKPLSFQRTVLNMTGVLGKDVKLLCQVKDGSANMEFSWRKDGLKLSNNSGPNYIIGSNAVNRSSHLRLEKLSQSDAGVYGCLARDLDMSNNISAFGTLTIKVPAVVLEGPVAVNVTGGNLVISRCKSWGDPVPKIRWQVNGRIAKANQTKFISELTIKAVKSTIVNCTADNGFGLDWKTANINVLASPTVLTPTETTQPKWSAPLIIVPPKNLTAEKGDNVTLTCAAVGYPKPLIRWLVDERTYYENPLDDNMTHLTITISKDETAVKCEAQNLVAVDSKTAFITVPKVEASVRSEGFFSGTGFVLVLGFAAVAVLLIVGVAIILYRCRKMQLQNFKSPVDADKLQRNAIFDQHSNYCSNPNLLNYEVPRKRMEFIEELEQGNALPFEYDAFIIYSSKDEEWVRGTLLPTLEDKHGFKCCIHYRDFMPGVLYRQNMVNSVYASKKTVAVVSKNFFNSGFCESEFEYALLRLAERRDDSLIVIKLDDIDTRKLPLEVRKRSYIDCPKSIEKETWETKLVKSLNLKTR